MQDRLKRPASWQTDLGMRFKRSIPLELTDHLNAKKASNLISPQDKRGADEISHEATFIATFIEDRDAME